QPHQQISEQVPGHRLHDVLGQPTTIGVGPAARVREPDAVLADSVSVLVLEVPGFFLHLAVGQEPAGGQVDVAVPADLLDPDVTSPATLPERGLQLLPELDYSPV